MLLDFHRRLKKHISSSKHLNAKNGLSKSLQDVTPYTSGPPWRKKQTAYAWFMVKYGQESQNIKSQSIGFSSGNEVSGGSHLK